MNTEAIAALALLLSPGAGNVTVNRALAAAAQTGYSLYELIEMPDSAEINFGARTGVRGRLDVLSSDWGNEAYAIGRCDADCLEKAAYLVKSAEDAGAQALPITGTDYPPSLLGALGNTAPPILFVAGNLALLDTSSAGIVGARSASEQGLDLARDCAAAFASEGIPVVSGGAKGVDSAAHAAALADGGSTVVVLPQGFLTYQGRKELMWALDDGHAAIVSEFAPNTPWSPRTAVTRNATISALVRLLCVIEPKKTGGSIRTAQCALDLDKRVLVHCSDDADSPINTLRRQGALPLVEDGVFDAQALLERWRTAPQPPAKRAGLS